MPTAGDLAVSSQCRRGHLRSLGANFQDPTTGAPGEWAAKTVEDAAATLAQKAAAEAAAVAERPSPVGTKMLW